MYNFDNDFLKGREGWKAKGIEGGIRRKGMGRKERGREREGGERRGGS